MQKRKIAALAGVTLLSAGFLAACGNASSSNSETSTTYSYVYTSDPATLDYIAVNRQQTSAITTNMVDGLLENDQYGNLVPSLAEDWKVSKDGLTYTYTLREGVKWYTVDGEEYADVTAEDFVTSIKHAVDVQSEGLYIIQDSIAGLDAYVKGETNDFSTVGVKALDERTVQYTLARPETYWNSKLTMSIMMPVNAEFLESKGEDFGKAEPGGILYNGAYFISSMTAKSSLEYTKNENYWDAENVKIENVKLTYYDGSDPESLVKGFTDGNYVAARLFPNTSTYSAVKEQYEDNIYYNLQDATVYFRMLNANRTNYGHTSKTTDAQKTSTYKALQNKDFRQALTFAFDRQNYLAQSVGEDASAFALRNLVVPPTFVTAGEETFGDLVTKEMVNYGDEWANVDFSDGQNGLYDVEKAKAKFETAKAALQADGVEFPIHLDVPANQTSEVNVQQVSSMKQSLEAALGTENVIVDIQMVDEDTFLNIAFYTEAPDQNDYDITYGGWGPDYQDASTYLDVFGLNGANVDKLGVAASNTELISKLGLDEYDALLAEAAAETTDVVARNKKYAEAQAWLTDSALVIPYMSLGGTPAVSKVVPYTAAYGDVGIKGGGAPDYYKYMEVSTEINTAEDVYAKREKWLEEKEESNAKAQEALADHVEE